jgi:hypothetical protein
MTHHRPPHAAPAGADIHQVAGRGAQWRVEMMVDHPDNDL